MASGIKGDVKFKIADDYIPVFTESESIEGAYSQNNSTSITQLDRSSLGDDYSKFEEGLQDVSGTVNIYLTSDSINVFSESGLGALLTLISFPKAFTGRKAWIENRLNDYFALAFSIKIETFQIQTTTDDRTILTFTWKCAGDFQFYEVQRTNFDLQNVENYVLQNLTNFEIAYVKDIGI